MDDEEEYLECPNCQCLWSMEEIDWQQCDACGWTNDEDKNDPDEDW